MAELHACESPYFDRVKIDSEVRDNQHREIIGGLWSEIGTLQFEFLRERGLRPNDKLIDVGCGPLRGGIHFVRYLNPGHYFGTDINKSLLDAGYDREIVPLDLAGRLPRCNLIEMHDFAFDSIHQTFDFALAQSVFTHLVFNNIRQCLMRLPAVMRSGACFYATIFEAPSGGPPPVTLTHQPGSVVTYATRDPYHYSVADMRYAIAGLPWRLEYIGDWAHPRGQKMLAFIRL